MKTDPISPVLITQLTNNESALKSLELRACDLNDEQVIRLASALKNNTQLVTLDLAYNMGIGSPSAYALSQCSGLKSLNLAGNNIGDAGAKGLARSTTLDSLFLQFNKITTQGAQALVGNSNLSLLMLEGNYLEAQVATSFNNNMSLTSVDYDLWDFDPNLDKDAIRKNINRNRLSADEFIAALDSKNRGKALDLLKNGVNPSSEYLRGKLNHEDRFFSEIVNASKHAQQKNLLDWLRYISSFENPDELLNKATVYLSQSPTKYVEREMSDDREQDKSLQNVKFNQYFNALEEILCNDMIASMSTGTGRIMFTPSKKCAAVVIACQMIGLSDISGAGVIAGPIELTT